MPLTEKGTEIRENMQEEYGPEKAEKVFYASKNAGTISGVDAIARATEIAAGPGLDSMFSDAVLNWGSGNYNVLPGGTGDPGSMEPSAKKSTGMGGETHNTGSQ